MTTVHQILIDANSTYNLVNWITRCLTDGALIYQYLSLFKHSASNAVGAF